MKLALRANYELELNCLHLVMLPTVDLDKRHSCNPQTPQQAGMQHPKLPIIGHALIECPHMGLIRS